MLRVSTLFGFTQGTIYALILCHVASLGIAKGHEELPMGLVENNVFFIEVPNCKQFLQIENRFFLVFRSLYGLLGLAAFAPWDK